MEDIVYCNFDWKGVAILVSAFIRRQRNELKYILPIIGGFF